MSASHRSRRLQVYGTPVTATSTDGTPTQTYPRQVSTTIDGGWWGSRAVPTGRETTLGTQAEHTHDAVFALSAHAPVSENGLIRDHDGALYLVTAVLPRDYGTDEVQVLAKRSDDAQGYVTEENPA